MDFLKDKSYSHVADFLAQAQITLGDGIAYQIEQKVSALINPKPKRMSAKTWENMCRKVLTLAYHPQSIKRVDNSL